MSTGRTISTSGASTSRRDAWTFGLSIAVHVVVLGWGALTFAARPLTSDATPMPIDIISVSEFTELTAGSRTAPKSQPAPPVVDKLGERKRADDPVAKVAKTEVHAATDKAAELPEPKLDPRQIQALLDKRTPQRLAATGDVVNSNVGIGAPTANSNQLALSEEDAFKNHLRKCWNAPAMPETKRIVVPITIRLKMDRTFAAPPQVEMRATDPYSRALIESAVRALNQCQPYTMFSLPRYDSWKELTVDFDPVEMFGG